MTESKYMSTTTPVSQTKKTTTASPTAPKYTPKYTAATMTDRYAPVSLTKKTTTSSPATPTTTPDTTPAATPEVASATPETATTTAETTATTPAAAASASPAATPAATPASAVDATKSTSQDYLKQYNAQREQKIRGLYDQAKANTLQGLKTAYDQSLAEQQRAYDQISPQYQESMNQLSAEYERQRRNNNMQAVANGLNTGAGSQMQLGQMNAYTTAKAGLQKQENEALDTANQNMVDLKTNYQNQIAQAVSNNDYQQAAALLDEFGKQYERQMTQASQLAEYGDFTMYASIYGAEAAKQMEKAWALQNPLLAYNLGKLTADEYFKMTGQHPPGVGGGGGGYGGGDGGGGGGYYYGGGGSSGSGDTFYRSALAQNANAGVSGLAGKTASTESQAAAILTEYNNRMAAHYGK